LRRKIGVFLAVALCLSLVLTSCVSEPKTPTSAPNISTIPQLEARISALEATMAKMNTSPVTADQLAQVKADLTATRSDVKDIQTQLKTSQTNVADYAALNKKVTDLQAQLDTSNARIKVLEAPPTTIPVTTTPDAVTVEMSSYVTPTLEVGETTLEYTVTMKMANALNVPLKNVEVIFSLTPRSTVTGLKVLSDDSTMSSGSIIWGLVTRTSPSPIIFVSGYKVSGGQPSATQVISLKAKETRSIIVSITVEFDPESILPAKAVKWDVSAYCDSYDLG
jgi:hypothetical protein